jgi:hypothetical protein
MGRWRTTLDKRGLACWQQTQKKNEMNTHNLDNKSTEQLQTKLRINEAINITLIIVLSLFMAFTIYGLIAKEDTSTFIALFAIACTSWSFLPLQIEAVREIKTELNSRNPD